MDRKQIIMNFSTPPGSDDLEVMAASVIENLPEEMDDFCEELEVVIEDFPDEALEDELELDDPYELLAVYRSGKEISPGVEKKSVGDDDRLIIFRRPLLDMWCENQDDLMGLLRQVIIEELGKTFDFSDEEVEDMLERHYQGMF